MNEQINGQSEQLNGIEQKVGARVADEQRADEASERKSAATTLVDLADARYVFGLSTTGETYAVPKSGSKVVSLLRGSKTSLRNELARIYFQQNERAAPQQALADALLVIEGFAQQADERELFLRAARFNGECWLDLGDNTGRAIRINGQGWTVTSDVPILFKRTALNGPLPEPEVGGCLDDLWGMLNVAVSDRPIVAAWLVAALIHDMPHPPLVLDGEQGTGKSTAQKTLVRVIDPGPVPTRKPPRDPDSWITAAAGSWIVGLDNLSEVQPWLSDSICRAVTGDGDVRRKLYTDGEHAVFSFRRCICLNGIDLGALRGDLSERMLPITLDRISDNKRRTEEDLWQKWEQKHPQILGAILDLAARVMGHLPFVELTSKPRMADFARILAAVDMALKTKGLPHYLAKQTTLAHDSLTGDPFTVALTERTHYFEGTSAALLEELTTKERPPKGWPTNARRVTQILKRNAPALRKCGWQISNMDDGHNKQHATKWGITPPVNPESDHPEKVRNSSSPTSLPRQNGRSGEEASMASNKYGQSQDEQLSDSEVL